MKIVFVSNYYTHHQSPFSREMNRLIPGDYCFIETESFSDQRKRMGWDRGDTSDYVLTYSDNTEKCQELIDNADAVIWGSCPFDLIVPRLKEKKLTFHYSERPFKDRNTGTMLQLRRAKLFTENFRYQKNHYLLSAGAYSYYDFAGAGLFKDRAFKWGYFPEVKEYENGFFDKKGNNKTLSLLWAGRFLDWKHPELAILLSEKLVNDGIEFHLNIIGTGEKEEELKAIIKDKKLDNFVSLIGSMPPGKVREYMEDSDIFLFTSGYYEGWGAVLNEAMNSGCAVVASDSPGAVPYLIKKGENGLVFENNSLDTLYNETQKLINDRKLIKALGEKAYYTITNEWSPKIAAERVIALTEYLLSGKPGSPFETGICSKAEILRP